MNVVVTDLRDLLQHCYSRNVRATQDLGPAGASDNPGRLGCKQSSRRSTTHHEGMALQSLLGCFGYNTVAHKDMLINSSKTGHRYEMP